MRGAAWAAVGFRPRLALLQGAEQAENEDAMAADNIDHGKQIKAHEGTYGFFVGLMKWGTIVAAIITLIVVLLISG
jgi:hypothetical protein